MFKTLFIAVLASLLGACSTTIGRSAATDTTTMGASGASSQNFRGTVGPQGNGP